MQKQSPKHTFIILIRALANGMDWVWVGVGVFVQEGIDELLKLSSKHVDLSSIFYRMLFRNLASY